MPDTISYNPPSNPITMVTVLNVQTRVLLRMKRRTVNNYLRKTSKNQED